MDIRPPINSALRLPPFRLPRHGAKAVKVGERRRKQIRTRVECGAGKNPVASPDHPYIELSTLTGTRLESRSSARPRQVNESLHAILRMMEGAQVG